MNISELKKKTIRKSMLFSIQGQSWVNIMIEIPDYLSFKTYSVILKNLPMTAIVTRGQGVTSFCKNMTTGLINFGYSTDTTERAARYVQKHLANPNNDTLDAAWHFVKLLGELQTPYAAQLPHLNEFPVLSSVSIPSSLTSNKVTITTTNSNKEFGEANSLEMSTTEDFASFKSYQIPWQGGHKYYDPVDSSCKDNRFDIEIPFLFNQQQTLYFRLKNIDGYSNTKSVVTMIVRTAGVNDPSIQLIPNTQFKQDDYVACAIHYANVSEFRYQLDGNAWVDWMTMVSAINIPMTIGSHSATIQGRNNLNETVEQVVTINFTGKQQMILFGNIANPGTVDAVGYVNKVNNPVNAVRNVFDLEGNLIGKDVGKYYPYNKSSIDLFRAKYGITLEVDITAAYWEIPDLLEDNGKYPNSLITNAGKKDIQMYGGVRADSTQQTVKYLTDMPSGSYKVKILLSAKANAAYKYPAIIRVQNQTITIPAEDSAKVINNNQYWFEFDHVTVDNDGLLLISQYTDVMLTGGLDRLSPIVLLEITKVKVQE